MWEYRAASVRVIDGDTLRLLIDVGFSVRVEEDVRLLDVHAPELSEAGGLETSTYVEEWISQIDPRRRWPLIVHTSPTAVLEPTERRSFTRWLARVWRIDAIAPSLNADITTFLTGHPEWGPGQ